MAELDQNKQNILRFPPSKVIFKSVVSFAPSLLIAAEIIDINTLLGFTGATWDLHPTQIIKE